MPCCVPESRPTPWPGLKVVLRRLVKRRYWPAGVLSLTCRRIFFWKKCAKANEMSVLSATRNVKPPWTPMRPNM